MTLTRFESTRVLGARALQVSLGAPVLIKTKNIDPVQIAREEVAAGVIKMIVIRQYADGSVEKVDAS